MNDPELFNEGHEATYCPEDDKIRLYVGRVPRDEYLSLRSEGWTSTPKQDCDFVAVWRPQRENTAQSYAGVIGDEDQSPTDRAADRAERFGGYLEKRRAEAHGHADNYDTGPSAHGFQNQQKAERAAARHDRHADRALDQWAKAEYWQSRTAGVISHALYVCTPGVRMGRIKKIEAENRKIEKDGGGARDMIAQRFKSFLSIEKKAAGEDVKIVAFPGWNYCTTYYKDREGITPLEIAKHATVDAALSIHGHEWSEKQEKALRAGETTPEAIAAEWLDAHGRTEPEAYDPTENRWFQHNELRLAYENQMIEAAGGRGGDVEMVPGGFLDSHQVETVHKSHQTGRVVSVKIWHPTDRDKDPDGNQYDPETNPRPLVLWRLGVERIDPTRYRAPTAEELAEFKAKQKERRAETKKQNTGAPKLVNPTDEDAARLQKVWNEQNMARNKQWGDDTEPEPLRMTQAEYSAGSKGWANYSTREMIGGGRQSKSGYGHIEFPTVAKVRANYMILIVITDKPQKPFPAHCWDDPKPLAVEAVRAEVDKLKSACACDTQSKMSDNETRVFELARLAGLAVLSSWSQFGLTDAGRAMVAEHEAANPTPEPVPEVDSRRTDQAEQLALI